MHPGDSPVPLMVLWHQANLWHLCKEDRKLAPRGTPGQSLVPRLREKAQGIRQARATQRQQKVPSELLMGSALDGGPRKGVGSRKGAVWPQSESLTEKRS